MVSLLLETYKADPNVEDAHEETPLIYVFRNGANVNHGTTKGQSALLCACDPDNK